MRTARGHATDKGTRKRANDGSLGDAFYRDSHGLMLSTLGIGTYLGDTGPEDREAYQASIQQALDEGITVVDTASNYRNQASERDVGQALDAAGNRDGAFVVTKGGFLHGDVDRNASVRQVVRDVYVDEGLLEVDDVAGGSHAMTPAFLEHELDQSLENLGVDTIDLYLVHNPETQLAAGIDEDTVYQRLTDAFTFLETQRDQGRVRGYGVATWDGLRVPPHQPDHLSLERLMDAARKAHEDAGGTGEHGFRGVQLPFNLAMPEALSTPTQPWHGERVPLLEAARDAELRVLASASMLQGRLLGNVPDPVKDALGVDTDLEAILQFARSAPGVTTALVGMGTPEHVAQNLDAAQGRPVDPDAVQRLVDEGEDALVDRAPS